jgi:hypothetical protein
MLSTDSHLVVGYVGRPPYPQERWFDKGQFMFWCCQYPLHGSDDVKKTSQCFQTTRAKEAAKPPAGRLPTWIEDDDFLQQAKGVNPDVVPAAAVPPCDAGYVMRGLALQTCEFAFDDPAYGKLRSKWQVQCGRVQQAAPPPPNAPPPAPDWEFDIGELDWRGEVDATVYLAFGPDVDNDFAQSTLGVIKAEFDFHTEGDEFTVDKLKISAGVTFEKPAEEGSWQALRGWSRSTTRAPRRRTRPRGW